MNKHKAIMVGGAVSLTAVAVLTMSACDPDDHRGKGDAPVSNGRHGDDSPAAVTNFPDGFANIATKCVAGAPGFRAFTSTRSGAQLVLPDTNCK